MTTLTRNLSNIDGANTPPPTQNGFSASKLPPFVDDAAYEAVFGPGAEGSLYFNTTIQSVRYYKNAAWQDILADEVFFDNSGTNIVAITVQGALVELDTELDTLITDFDAHELSTKEHGVDPSGDVMGTVGSTLETVGIGYADDATDAVDIDLTPTKVGTRMTGLTANRNLRSVVATNLGYMVISNVTAFTLTIIDEDAGATAADRIITGTGSDLALEAGSSLLLSYDTTSARWRVVGGVGGGGEGGGGLEIEIVDFAASPVTGDIGKWYLTDTTAGEIVINLPDIVAIPSADFSKATVKVSDCANNWHVNKVSLVPASGQSIDGNPADEVQELDVESQNVQVARGSATNWCLDTNFQPTLEGTGGGGVGELNFVANSDFEDGTDDWSKTGDFSALTVDASTPLEGVQSLAWTNNYSSTRGKVSGLINTVDLAYRGVTAQCSAVFRVVGTGGTYLTYLTKDSVKVEATESTIDATGGGIFYPAALGTFTFDDSAYEYVVEDISGTSGDVLTLDLVKASTNGAGRGSAGGWKVYDDIGLVGSGAAIELSGLGNTTISSIPNAWVRPQKDPTTGEWSLEGTLDFIHNSDASVEFSISGISINVAGGGGFDVFSHQNPSTVTDSRTSTTTSIIVNRSSASSRTIIGFSFRLNSKPTWADFDNAIEVMSKGTAVEAVQGRFYYNGTSYIYTANNPINFNTEDTVTFDPATGISSSGTGIFTATRKTTLTVTSVVQSAPDWGANTLFAIYVSRSGGGATAEQNLDRCPGAASKSHLSGFVNVMLNAGDAFYLGCNGGGTVQTGSANVWISFVEATKSTGQGLVGSGTDASANEKPQYLTPNKQKFELDFAGSGDFTSGKATLYIDGDKADLVITEGLVCSSQTGPESSAIIPNGYRPAASVFNVIFALSGAYMANLIFTSSGTVQILGTNYSGSNVPVTGTSGTLPSTSWKIV